MAGGVDLGVFWVGAEPAVLGGVVGEQGCLAAGHGVGEGQGVVGFVGIVFNVLAG